MPTLLICMGKINRGDFLMGKSEQGTSTMELEFNVYIHCGVKTSVK